MLHQLLTEEKLPDPPQQQGGRFGRRGKVYPYALIMGPTRELVCQIHEEACKVMFHSRVEAHN